MSTFDLKDAHRAVELDTIGVLGAFFDGEFKSDPMGPSNWHNGKSEFFAVRWTYVGTHTGAIPGFGHTFIEPTGNSVSVAGLTLVENKAPDGKVPDDLDSLLRGGTVVFQRFIDWLAVFGQLGVLHLGRPMAISDISFEAPTRGTSRLPGYNDQQQGA
jgi:hypothetical protein